MGSPRSQAHPSKTAQTHSGGRPQQAAANAEKRPLDQWRNVWPEILEMMRPRKTVLFISILVMIVNRLCSLVLPLSSKYLIDSVLIPRNASALRPVLLIIAAATAIQGLTSMALVQTMSKAAHRLIADLRIKIQSHISRLPISYYDANQTGTVICRIMTDVEGLRNLLGTGMIDFLGGALTALVVIVALLATDWTLTLISIGALAALFFAMRKGYAYVRPVFRERWKINAEVTARLTESIGGVRVVKAYRAEARERHVFARGAQRIFDNALRSLTFISSTVLVAALLTGSVSIAIMYIGAQQIFAGHLMVGDLVKYITLLSFLIASVFQIVNMGTQITEAIAGLDRTHEVLREKPEDEDVRRTVTLPEISGWVEFQDVHFGYEERNPVLKGISFVAKPGTVTALVGPSGAGKSTLMGLLAAFYTPQSGVVCIDGVDLSAVRLESYRTQLGVVFQDTFLFEGSIWDNVAFSRPGAPEAEILHACRTARVEDFALLLPDGYNTLVGERGVKLSGGERQRITIARAILVNPRILLLDEATSSLDSKSETLIQQGLSHLMRGRTTFVIAHRLSTIERADQILILEQGRIVERGAHDDLFAAQGSYWSLYTNQHGMLSRLARV